MTRRARLLSILACAAAVSLWPRAAAAQSADDLFNDAAVQRLDLWINSRDWAELRATFEENQHYPASLVWRGLTARNVAVRSRGFGTRDAVKPGLLLEFDRYVAGQRFLGLKQLVLDNLRQDPSGIHEMLAMAIHRRLGLPAPREAPAALYVNGRFLGQYAIVEAVDDVAVSRMFGRPEGTGYVFEYRWTDEYLGTYLGPDPSAYRRLLEPRTHETDPDRVLYTPIEAALRAINESPDDEFVQQVSPYFDLGRVMRYLAVQSYAAEWDGLAGYAGMNNFYLYRAGAEGRSELVPWDEDYAFVAVDYPVDGGTTNTNVLLRRALAVPELRQAFFDSLAEIAALSEEGASEGTPGWLEREVIRLRDLTAEGMRADRVKPFQDEEVDRAFSDLLEFAHRRPAFVRAEIERLKAFFASRPGGI